MTHISEPTHSDLCILQRLWNRRHGAPGGCDERVNTWLKTQIELARQRDAAPSEAMERFEAEQVAEKYVRPMSRRRPRYRVKGFPL